MDCRARFLGAVETPRTPRSLRWATILPAEPTLARERCVCRGGRRGGVSSRCSARFSAGKRPPADGSFRRKTSRSPARRSAIPAPAVVI